MRATLFLTVSAWTIVNLLQALFSPLIDDEAYYWMWSRQLAWGYFDHPPMVALWIKMGFSVFQNELGLRLLGSLLNSATLFFLLAILQPKGKNEFRLFMVIFLSFVFVHVYGFVLTPDSPLFFFQAVYCYALFRFLKKEEWKTATLLGISMAGLMYSKYHGVLIIVFSLLPLIPRYWKNGRAYLAIVVSLILYAPHIIWQIDNDWVSFGYHIVERNVNNHFKVSNTLDYLVICLGCLSPFLVFHTFKALAKSWLGDPFIKAMACMVWGILCFFLLTTFKRYIQAQWIMAVTLPLIILTYLYWKDKTRAHRLIYRLGGINISLLLLARLYFTLPDPPIRTPYHGWEDFMTTVGENTEDWVAFTSYQQPSLFTFYNYPEKEATRWKDPKSRYSQYELWKDRELLDDRPFSFVEETKDPDNYDYLLQTDDTKFYIQKEFPALDLPLDINAQTEILDIANSGPQLEITLMNKSTKGYSFPPESILKLGTYEQLMADSFLIELDISGFIIGAGQNEVLLPKIPQDSTLELSPEELLIFIGIKDLPLWQLEEPF